MTRVSGLARMAWMVLVVLRHISQTNTRETTTNTPSMVTAVRCSSPATLKNMYTRGIARYESFFL